MHVGHCNDLVKRIQGSITLPILQRPQIPVTSNGLSEMCPFLLQYSSHGYHEYSKNILLGT